ncbi:hypothetical protein [Embleya sp. NPDC005575]|uniref:hypothetical protein n=1 Tax=Embleya sp. NPDC005575 TaxID=3156892 RepID=UPI0033A6FFD3
MTSPVPPPAFEFGTDGPRAVPVGVDGSRTSLRAADYALGQARRGGAEPTGASEHFDHRLIGSLAIRLVRSARRPVRVIPRAVIS